MPEQETSENPLASTVIRLANIIIVLVIALIVALLLFAVYFPGPTVQIKQMPAPQADKNGLFTEAARQAILQPKDSVVYWQAPNESELALDQKKELILYGRELIVHTSDYYGPKGKIYSSYTNGMNCQNCHLEAGTKVFGNNYSAVASTFPKYRARSGNIENIYKRVNDCFERSLNGKGIDTNSKEMQAIVSYMKWLGKYVEKGQKPKGSGLKELAFLDRAADPEKGELVYKTSCSSCHQPDGRGLLNGDKSGYIYPPLWGDLSYTDGAGLIRLSNFAKYIKYNMPIGTSYNNPQLSDEEAWDVAAFVNSQARPMDKHKNDWPNCSEKPIDHPFGPYSDHFSEARHKYGPYAEIQNTHPASLKK